MEREFENNSTKLITKTVNEIWKEKKLLNVIKKKSTKNTTKYIVKKVDHTGRKYFQIVYLVKDLYTEYQNDS